MPTGYSGNSATGIVVDEWTYWATTTATSSTCDTMIWDHWNGTGTASTTSSTWTLWVTNGTGAATTVNPWAIRETEEEAAARKVRQEAYDERIRKEAEERKAAEAKAERLLQSVLDSVQKAQYAKEKAFVVEGRRGRYRIRHGRVANVEVIGKDGYQQLRLCAHPGEYVPNADTMTAQKLMLECPEGEEAFWAKANQHGRDNHAPVLAALHQNMERWRVIVATQS